MQIATDTQWVNSVCVHEKSTHVANPSLLLLVVTVQVAEKDMYLVFMHLS